MDEKKLDSLITDTLVERAERLSVSPEVKAAAVRPKLMLWSMVRSVLGSIPCFFKIYSNTI